MSKEGSSDTRVTKLSNNNYRSWKIEMKWYLRGKGLLDYVLNRVEITSNATEAQRIAHIANENKAIAAIGLNVDDEQQVHIEECVSAHDAWIILEQVHQPKSRVRIMQLKKEFYHLKMKDDENMPSYLARAKIAATNLREAGAEVSDEDLAYTLLSGLPDSYENLNMTLANLPDDKFTSAEVKRVLLAEYNRRAAREVVEGESSKEALHVDGGSEDKKNKQRVDNKNKSVTCFKCKKSGHFAKDCRSKSDRGRRKQEQKSKRDYDAFLLSINNLEIDDVWLLDSGCTHHVCRRKEWFTEFRELDSETVNTAADPERQSGANLKAKGIGNIILKILIQGKKNNIKLHDVYYVPDIRKNLLSVSQIEKKNKILLFEKGKATIRSTITGKTVCEAYRKNDLYIIKAEVDAKGHNSVESHALNVGTDELWHQRFCHTNHRTIVSMAESNKVRGLNSAKNADFSCDACRVGKATKLPCRKLKERQSKQVCELIHSDVCGPMPVNSIGGSRYFITFTDDFSRKTIVMCMKTKDEAKTHIKNYISRVERQQNKKVKRFRTDNGLEFCNKDLETYFKELGIKHETSNVETPQMNGIAERINRTLLDMTRSMLASASLPQKFWAEAVTTAAYIKNRVSHSGIDSEVPLAIWTNRAPSVRHLRVYGCLAYARLPRQGRNKLDKRAAECILVGYSSHTKGYRLWCPKTQDVITTKHVKFAEEKIGYEWIYKESIQDWRYDESSSEDENRDTTRESKTVELPEKRSDAQAETSQKENANTIQGERDRKIAVARNSEEVKKRGRPRKIIRNPYGCKGKPKDIDAMPHSDVESEEDNSTIEANLVEILEPKNLPEALGSPQASEWRNAMQEELNSLESRNTWHITELPKGKTAVGSKWVYKIKRDSEGKVARYKARLVAQGYSQKKGIDYEETYCPVSSFSVIRFLLALSAEFRWHTRHVDIKCAYLYGHLDEEIYMRLPPMHNNESAKIVRLLRPIYGLKQSGRNWNRELDNFLVKQGFKRLKSSNCTYLREEWTVIIVYVDDMFIFTRDPGSITQVTNELSKAYEVKDLGEMRHVLGVKVQRNSNGEIRLSQRTYIEQLLRRFNMTECRTAKTPLEAGIMLTSMDGPTTAEEIEEMSRVPYRELIGSLMYLALNSRPDILFATTKLSQYNANPGKVHWNEAKHVLRYLAGTKDYGITYKHSGEVNLNMYCDADWAGDTDHRHSFSGLIVCIGKNVIHWRSSKQRSLATSTMEAEYIAMSNAVKEGLWCEMFIKELTLIDYFSGGTINLYCDNRAAIDYSRNRVEKSRTKHIDISYHIVRENVENGLIKVTYIPSNENLADVMTKGLNKNAHMKCIDMLEMNAGKRGN